MISPKKTPGELRLIHHLSFPKDFSVNNGIALEHSKVSYATIDDAIHLIKQVGPIADIKNAAGFPLPVADIKNGFRLLPIHPNDYGLLGMHWRGLYY